MNSIARIAHLSLPMAILMAAGCTADEPASEVAEQESPEWTYAGETGPERWGTLSTEFATCQSGTTQSPINLTNATAADLPDLTFNYSASPLEIENKGHTLQVDYKEGSSITVDGAEYKLLQFHFHTPAEHQIQGKEYPAELHLVHQGPDDALAVVGVMIERGQENKALAPVWNHLPATRGDERQVDSVQVNAAELLPSDYRRYRYPGSLTTPPCTEGVRWMVLEKTIEMSAEQIQALQSIIGTSNRPIQPLGDRELRVGA